MVSPKYPEDDAMHKISFSLVHYDTPEYQASCHLHVAGFDGQDPDQGLHDKNTSIRQVLGTNRQLTSCFFGPHAL